MVRVVFSERTEVPEEASPILRKDKVKDPGDTQKRVFTKYAHKWTDEDKAYLAPDLSDPETGEVLARARCKPFDDERYVCAIDGGVSLFKKSKLGNLRGYPASTIIEEGKVYEGHASNFLDEDEIEKLDRLKEDLEDVSKRIEEEATKAEAPGKEMGPAAGALMMEIQELKERIDELEEKVED